MKMLTKCFGIAALLLATGFLAALPKTHAPDKYQTLVTRVKQGDTTVDLLELRRAYADSTEYTDGSDPDARKAMMSAFNKGDFDGALEQAKKIFDAYYLDIEAHEFAYLAYREMHNQEEAEFHHRIAHGLIQAIFQSGDGKSRETAWEVLSTHEEYIILQVLGLRPGSQSLIQDGKHSYDELEAVDPKTEQKVTLYFNIDTPMGYLHKALSK
ncbi:MAG: DUF4919 domain-containing protein [Terriglobia bacterium]